MASGYVERVVGLLGGRDPFEILKSTPKRLEALLAEFSPAEIRRPEAPGRWSVAQVIRHLADAELVWGVRFRMTIAEDRPKLAGYDENLWAGKLGYESADPATDLALLSAVRRSNVELLAALPPEAFERTALHSERGEESLSLMLKLSAGHDLAHFAQLDRIRAAVAR